MGENGNQQFPAKVIHKSSIESANFEHAMLLTGYGRYNLSLLLVCGLVMASCGSQFGLSAYILPSAQCDLQFTSGEMGLLNAAFMIGAMIGAVISGAIADAIGRRKILIWCLFIDGCVTLLSSLSPNFSILFVSRCINGLVIGGPTTIILSFFGEFHAKKSRAKAVCYLGFFWASAMVLLPAVAWTVIPLKINIVLYGFVFNSWRLFLSMFCLPGLLGSFLLSKYPESPKFLHSQGQNTKALEIMRQMFTSNTKQKAHYYPVETLISEYSTTHNEFNTFSKTLKAMWEQIRCLFSPPLGKYTILTGSILFANMFGYYGLGLWLPVLFNRFHIYHRSHPNATITVCELAYLRQEIYEPIDAKVSEHLHNTSNFIVEISAILSNATAVQLSDDSTTKICDTSVDAQVFVNTIIIGFSCVLGNSATAYLVNRWERRIMPIVTMLIPGICGCAIYFLRTSMQNLIVTCVFSSFLLMANMILYSVIIDIFPTNVSTMATAVASVFARLGAILSNILFGLLLDISCEIPIFLVGGVVIIGGLLGLLLPKCTPILPEMFEKKLSVRNENEHVYSTN